MIEGNALIREIPVATCPTEMFGTYRKEVVITKEEFLECYNAWVKEKDEG